MLVTRSTSVAPSQYADVVRGYSVVLRELLEQQAFALRHSRTKQLSFVHMLMRLKEHAGLQRALSCGMLVYKLACISPTEPTSSSLRRSQSSNLGTSAASSASSSANSDPERGLQRAVSSRVGERCRNVSTRRETRARF